MDFNLRAADRKVTARTTATDGDAPVAEEMLMTMIEARAPRRRRKKAEAPSGAPLTVTVKQARLLTGLGVTSIWKMVADGKLESVLVGRRRLIVYRSLQQLFAPEAA